MDKFMNEQFTKAAFMLKWAYRVIFFYWHILQAKSLGYAYMRKSENPPELRYFRH